jgi:hypothetical protein
MSTQAGTVGLSGRPALFTFWTVAVSVLAAAALILSAMALNVAGRVDRPVSVTSEAAAIGSPLWDASKLDAMKGRVLAGAVQAAHVSAPGWDASKLDAMQGRVLAGAIQAEATAGGPQWDVAKLQAMEGRVLAG